MFEMKSILTFVSTILIILILQLPFSHSCPHYQKEALLRFHSLLQGNNSESQQTFQLPNWNSTTDCCEWDHVVCESQKVTRILFYQHNFEESVPLGKFDVLTPLFQIKTLTHLHINMGFEGELHPEIGNLTKLETLDLSNNKLSGSIPSSLGRLTELYELNLGYNSLSMKIPAEIGNLTKLEYLDLRNNKLSGSIPSSLRHLKKLLYLYLGANSLSSIPSELSNLTNIEGMELGINNLSGKFPPWIHELKKLGSLDLEDNLLIGEIPIWLFDLSNLSKLRLGGQLLVLKNTSGISSTCELYILSLRSCNISGHIHVWLSNSNYTSLSELDLSENNLIGTIPEWLLNSSLYSLILSDNNLSGSISPLLFKQIYLNHLDLSRNNFSGYLPDNIGEASSLESLILSGNDLSGPIPMSISFIALKLLDLSKNRLSSNEFPNFEYLYILDLSFNLFFGKIPINFSNKLTMLVLCYNNFCGVFPPSLASLDSLSYLDLHDNNIIGKIPDFLFRISVLQILDLSNNYFEGNIPNNLSNLTRLQILDVSGNKLSGTVPPGLGNLNGMFGYNNDLKHLLRVPYLNDSRHSHILQIYYPDLEVFWKESKRNLPNQHLDMYTLLDLSNNQLFGEIPDTLGALRNLKVLNFSHNKLSGRIPSTINGLENLESLDLSYNNLSGEIPETIGKLLQLSTLELSNNELTGRIPTGPQMDRLNDPDSYANNNGLCGTQIRVPCDKPLPNENGKESDAESMEDWWFSWKMAAIGFPSGFLSTVLVLYNIGYFKILSKRQLQRQGRRRQYIMPCF